jgi:hypothetical protein
MRIGAGGYLPTYASRRTEERNGNSGCVFDSPACGGTTERDGGRRNNIPTIGRTAVGPARGGADREIG